MKNRTDHLNPEYTNLIEVEVRLDITIIREDFKIGLYQTMCTEEDQGMDKTIEVGQEHDSDNRGNYGYNTRGSQRCGRLNNNRKFLTWS